VLGSKLGRLLGSGYHYHLGTVTWSYDLTYRPFTRVGGARRLGELALYALGGSALAATVAGYDPDVVVGTHPVITTVLGRLRAAGRLRCPVVAVVGPLGGLAYWTHPGIDLHLLNYEHSLLEVERDAGAGRAVAVQPLIGQEFFAAPSQADARALLAIPGQRRLVLVSGGGWGVGDLHGAVEACLGVSGAHVIAVAGRNEWVRQGILQRHGGDPRVTVLGFTDHMRELLSAADIFITTTAGLSCLEAQLCGCPAICYGFTIGHVRDNTEALWRRGLAPTATTPAHLTAELTTALATGRRAAPRPRADLPWAAEVTAQIARRDARGDRTVSART
jgi:UDP-N-acetylglucosamine:LPS N-acetylglucosamine transferase